VTASSARTRWNCSVATAASFLPLIPSVPPRAPTGPAQARRGGPPTVVLVVETGPAHTVRAMTSTVRQTTAPTHVDITPRPAGGAVRSAFVAATGYARVGVGALAAGTYAGSRAVLVVPVERVVAADLRVRPATETKVLLAADGQEAPAVGAAIRAAVDALGAGPLEVQARVRAPQGSATGTDVTGAALAALGHALERTELFQGYQLQAARAAIATAGVPLGTTGPAILDPTGEVRATLGPVKAVLVIAAPLAGARDAAADLTGNTSHGHLVAPPATGQVASATDLAAWLTDCSAGGSHPAAAALADLRPAKALAVAGGHRATDPVVVVFEPADLAAAQELLTTWGKLLPADWRASIARTAAPAPASD